LECDVVARRKPTEFVQFKLRVRQELRLRLEREAKKSERSANNEAVARLEKSFDQETRVDEMLGGPQQAALLRLFASRLDLVRAKHGSGWAEGEALTDLARTIREVVEQIIPNVHSVRIALRHESGADLPNFTSYSEKAWADMLAAEAGGKR
jgi:hypothetical protein